MFCEGPWWAVSKKIFFSKFLLSARGCWERPGLDNLHKCYDSFFFCPLESVGLDHLQNILYKKFFYTLEGVGGSLG